MSVQTMARVWAQSQHGGSELLMLLAIADFADDDGKAYPGVTKLSKKCRIQPRAAQYSIAALKRSGELDVRVNEGPKGTNLYRIALERLGVQKVAPVQSIAPLQSVARGGAKDCAKGVQPAAPEPSLNHQRTTRPPKTPACPHLELIALFVQKIPQLPQPKPEFWSGKLGDGLRARWAWVLTESKGSGERYAETAAQGLEWFGRFFERVARSDFLTGRQGDFKCSLVWLTNETNFAKVVEGNYSNREAA